MDRLVGYSVCTLSAPLAGLVKSLARGAFFFVIFSKNDKSVSMVLPFDPPLEPHPVSQSLEGLSGERNKVSGRQSRNDHVDPSPRAPEHGVLDRGIDGVREKYHKSTRTKHAEKYYKSTTKRAEKIVQVQTIVRQPRNPSTIPPRCCTPEVVRPSPLARSRGRARGLGLFFWSPVSRNSSFYFSIHFISIRRENNKKKQSEH